VSRNSQTQNQNRQVFCSGKHAGSLPPDAGPGKYRGQTKIGA
jgi:hypothetical protein